MVTSGFSTRGISRADKPRHCLCKRGTKRKCDDDERPAGFGRDCHIAMRQNVSNRWARALACVPSGPERPEVPPTDVAALGCILAAVGVDVPCGRSSPPAKDGRAMLTYPKYGVSGSAARGASVLAASLLVTPFVALALKAA